MGRLLVLSRLGGSVSATLTAHFLRSTTNESVKGNVDILFPSFRQIADKLPRFGRNRGKELDGRNGEAGGTARTTLRFGLLSHELSFCYGFVEFPFRVER